MSMNFYQIRNSYNNFFINSIGLCISQSRHQNAEETAHLIFLFPLLKNYFTILLFKNDIRNQIRKSVHIVFHVLNEMNKEEKQRENFSLDKRSLNPFTRARTMSGISITGNEES